MQSRKKDILCFSSHSGTKDKLDPRCKECVKEQKKVSDEVIDLFENPYLDKIKCKPELKDWQGGKPFGTVFQRKGETTWSVKVGSKSKTFNTKDYENDINKANLAARNWRRKMSDTLMLTKNKYKIIHNDDGEPKYIIVQLTDNYAMLCDYDDLDLIKRISLFVTFSGGNNKSRYPAFSNNSKFYLFHRYKFKDLPNDKVIDHISGFPLDNRQINLRKTTIAENNRNKLYTTTVKQKKPDYKLVPLKVVKKIKKKDKTVYSAIVNYYWYDDDKSEDFKIEMKEFDSKISAKMWIGDIENNALKRYLDVFKLEKEIIKKRVENNPILSQREKLAKEFLTIMKTHAPEFKYQNNEEDEHKEKDTKIEKKKKDSTKKNSILTKKEEIFNKFLKINEDYDITPHLIKGNKIEHIKDSNNEYKYCSNCKKWLLTDSFYAISLNYDGLDRFCKTCKNLGNNITTKLWKEKNKNKIKEYNEQYRKKHGSSYKRIDDSIKEKKKLERRQAYFEKFLSCVSKHEGGICLSTVDDYQTAHSKLKVQCCKGHQWETTLNNVSKGKWCKDCHLSS